MYGGEKEDISQLLALNLAAALHGRRNGPQAMTSNTSQKLKLNHR